MHTIAGEVHVYVAKLVTVIVAVVLTTSCSPLIQATISPQVHNDEPYVEIMHMQTLGTENVITNISQPFAMNVKNGRFTNATLQKLNSEESIEQGALDETFTTWTTNKPLLFGSTYTVNAEVVNAVGEKENFSKTFTTPSPQQTVNPISTYIGDGQKYGIGIPIEINFLTTVENKTEVEKAIKIFTTTPVEGAWSWNENDTKVTFRPKNYWPANTQVYMQGNFYGVKLNNTTYANSDLTLDFNVGDATIMTVDEKSFSLNVTVNNVLTKTIPITLGKPGFETHEGVKVISAKEGTITMRSAPDSSEPYVVNGVEYSMRLTQHGEYLHAAPWSVNAFGNYADSHGCISMTTSNAKELWDIAKVGDIVVVTGTGFPPQRGNEISAWNVPWDEWLQKSATGTITTNVK